MATDMTKQYTVLRGLKYGIKNIKPLVFTHWFLGILYDLSPLLFSTIWAYLIDTAVKGITENKLEFNILLVPFILFIALEIVKALSKRWRDYLHNRIFDKLENSVNIDLFTKYSSLDVQSLEDPEVNKIFQAIRGPYEWRIRSLVFTAGSFISAFILNIIALIMLFSISPLISLVAIVTMLPSLLINMKYGAISWGIWNEDLDKKRKYYLNKEFLMNRDNLIEAKVNNAPPYLIQQMGKVLEEYHRKRKPMLRDRAVFMFFADLIRVTGTISSIYLLIQSTVNGDLSIGELVLAASIFLSFTSSLENFLYELTELFNAGLFFKEFLNFMDLKTKVHSGVKKIGKLKTPPHIEFCNVSFKYPGTERLILKDVDFKIEPGSKVALVGENGAGKTTIIKLLVRFYEPVGGHVLIDGEELGNLDTVSWLQNLGLLTQHFNTYAAFNLKDNIRLGDISKEYSEKQLISAAERAKVDVFVDKYKNGYKQLLSAQFTDGVDPSWGQWQRIGIARTLYRDPSIVILDEPTSAIDAQAEFEIFQNINKQTEGKTVVYVSHRYSTVRNADKILVLKDGEIVESGKHEELMSLNGEYTKNFNLQAEGYKN